MYVEKYNWDYSVRQANKYIKNATEFQTFLDSLRCMPDDVMQDASFQKAFKARVDELYPAGEAGYAVLNQILSAALTVEVQKAKDGTRTVGYNVDPKGGVMLC